MTHDRIWQTLISAAMLGTERQPIVLPEVRSQEGLDRLLAQIDTSDPAKALLRAAAVLTLTEKAAHVPPIPDFQVVAACIREELPMCSPEAADSLQRMLAGEFAAVLPEWLARVALAGWRVPPENLPDLLSWGSQNSPWRSLVLPVLGNRGRWLAAQNPDWQYAEDSIDRSIWETGTTATRLWVLQLMRQSDPAMARDWISSTWKQDKAPDRAAFLGTFTFGLSLADEPLLEFALDDKSKLVRAIAADLLARLPDSQLTHRAIERLERWVGIVIQPSLQIEVTLPQFCDDAAVRDGIVVQPPSGMEEKAWWLLQMLGQVPPSFWTAMGNPSGAKPVGERFVGITQSDPPTLSPAALLKGVASSPCYGIWLEGMAIAAVRHKDLDWAQALLTVLPTVSSNRNTRTELCQNLMALLPFDRREALVWKVLHTHRGDRLNKNHPLLFLLRLCRHLWSPQLSLAVLQRVANEISTSQDTYNWGVRSTVLDCAYFINPAVVDDAHQLLKTTVKSESYWAQTVEEFWEILQFRHQMLAGISGDRTSR